MKIAILGEDHSIRVQHALFALGFNWLGEKNIVKHASAPFIYANTSLFRLTFDSVDLWFKTDTRTEYILDETTQLLIEKEIS